MLMTQNMLAGQGTDAATTVLGKFNSKSLNGFSEPASTEGAGSFADLIGRIAGEVAKQAEAKTAGEKIAKSIKVGLTSEGEISLLTETKNDNPNGTIPLFGANGNIFNPDIHIGRTGRISTENPEGGGETNPSEKVFAGFFNTESGIENQAGTNNISGTANNLGSEQSTLTPTPNPGESQAEAQAGKIGSGDTSQNSESVGSKTSVSGSGKSSINTKIITAVDNTETGESTGRETLSAKQANSNPVNPEGNFVKTGDTGVSGDKKAGNSAINNLLADLTKADSKADILALNKEASISAENTKKQDAEKIAVSQANSANPNLVSSDINKQSGTLATASSDVSAANLSEQKISDAKSAGQNTGQTGENRPDITGDSKPDTAGGEKKSDSIAGQNFARHFEASKAGKTSQTQTYSRVRPEQFAEMTARISKTLMPDGTAGVKMAMTPKGLGTVFVNFEVKDGRLNLKIDADNKDTLKKIEQQLGALKEGIAKQGLKLENVEFGNRQTTDSDGQTGKQDFSGNSREGRNEKETRYNDTGADIPNITEENAETEKESRYLKTDSIIEEYI